MGEAELRKTAAGQEYLDRWRALAGDRSEEDYRHEMAEHDTACAEIGFWNAYGRWVNRGARGIALLVEGNSRNRLRHVFDVSDTNSETGREAPIWTMQPRYEAAVIEDLENSYGVEGGADLPACLMSAAKTVVEDNYSDYLTDMINVKAGSLLEELDEQSTKVWFRGLVEDKSIYFIHLFRSKISDSEQKNMPDLPIRHSRKRSSIVYVVSSNPSSTEETRKNRKILRSFHFALERPQNPCGAGVLTTNSSFNLQFWNKWLKILLFKKACGARALTLFFIESQHCQKLRRRTHRNGGSCVVPHVSRDYGIHPCTDRGFYHDGILEV